jgi:hypothetical protein
MASHANRARLGCHGTGVKLARSGIADVGIRGDLPELARRGARKARAVLDERAQVGREHELRARPRVHVDEPGEEELDPARLHLAADVAERRLAGRHRSSSVGRRFIPLAARRRAALC